MKHLKLYEFFYKDIGKKSDVETMQSEDDKLWTLSINDPHFDIDCSNLTNHNGRPSSMVSSINVEKTLRNDIIKILKNHYKDFRFNISCDGYFTAIMVSIKHKYIACYKGAPSNGKFYNGMDIIKYKDYLDEYFDGEAMGFFNTNEK